ncbi:hypothetical protein CKAH01_06367 [Colletotrichum kahawae]|uniref:Uncharacterized protein n=1 Tax=Colletotrichum kahawae TaxID=34407 RepID=A0AAD9YCB9_COLKA|nr:hypothetical protein CKAH01_06367 [Colletotrichum kahawae]
MFYNYCEKAGIKEHQYHWVDRTYNGKGKEARYGNRSSSQERRSGSAATAGFKPQGSQPRGKCWICKKDGCWSTSYTQEERDKSYKKFKQLKGTEGKNSLRQYKQFLVNYEGIDPSIINEIYGSESEEDITTYLARVDDDISDGINEIDEVNHTFFAPSALGGYSYINQRQAVNTLNEQAFFHG